MGNLVLNKEGERYWQSYILQRIKKNKNFLGFISGSTGSGKSWSSMSIGEILDPERFNSDRIVFSGIELMDLINTNLPKGSVIVFEEVGIEMSNKNWQSVTNKMLNYLMQTFRHRNLILIMNSPFMDFVDSATRKLFHAEMRTISIDRNNRTCKLKPQLIQYNSRKQKFYYKRLKVITEKGVFPITYWNIPKPSSELIKGYEIKKKAYTDALNLRIRSELNKLDKVSKPTYPAFCERCDYKWESTKEQTSKCPKCHSRHTKLRVSSREIGLNGLKTNPPQEQSQIN